MTRFFALTLMLAVTGCAFPQATTVIAKQSVINIYHNGDETTRDTSATANVTIPVKPMLMAPANPPAMSQSGTVTVYAPAPAP